MVFGIINRAVEWTGKVRWPLFLKCSNAWAFCLFEGFCFNWIIVNDPNINRAWCIIERKFETVIRSVMWRVSVWLDYIPFTETRYFLLNVYDRAFSFVNSMKLVIATDFHNTSKAWLNAISSFQCLFWILELLSSQWHLSSYRFIKVPAEAK